MIKEREREWHIRIKDPAIYIYIITNGDGGDHTRRQEALRPKEMMRQKNNRIIMYTSYYNISEAARAAARGTHADRICTSTTLTSLRPRLVQYSKTALPASDGIPPLDHVPRAAIAAPVLDTAHRRDGGRDGRRRGGGGGGGGAGGAPAAVGRRGVHVVRFVYCVCVFLYRADGGEKVW